MAQWRKVIVSGSNAELNNINSSGNVVPTVTNGGSLGTSALNWSDLFLDSGAVINFDSDDVTVTHSGNLLDIDGGNTRVDRLELDSASDYLDVSTDLQIVANADVSINAGGGNVKPSANDGSALGVSGTGWSDLFLASGAVVNFNAGDVTLTHSANALTVGGGDVLVGDNNVSGSSASTASFGYLNVTGDGVFGGNLTFGDAGTDSVSFGADIDSNLIPNTDDTYDLGSASQAWQDLFLEGDITLTDAGTIQTSAGVLTIDGAGGLTLDSDGTDAVNLGTEAVAKTITIGNAASTKVDINALALDFDSAAATDILAATTLSAKGAGGASFGDDVATWEFNGSGAVSETGMTTVSITPSSTFDIDAGGAVTIDGSAITIGGDSDVAIDIDSSTLDIDASGAITIDGTSTILISGDGGATFSDDTEALVYDGSGNVDFDAVALDIDASGAVTIDGTSTILISGDGGATFSDDTEALVYDGSGNVDFDAVAFDLDASGALTIDSATSIGIGTTADKPIDIDATTFDVDASGALTMTSTTMAFDPSSTFDIDAAGAVTIDGSAITIGGDSDVAVDIDSSTLDIDASGAITIDSTSGVSIDGGAASNLTTSAGALTLDGAGGVNIAGNAAEIDITTSAALDLNSGAFTLNGSTVGIDGSAALTLGASEMNIDADGGTIDIDATSTITVGGTNATGVTIGKSDTTVTVPGSLDVNGTLTTIDTTNLKVADRFILMASGSSAGDGGIVVETNGAGSGTALGYDDSASRWALSKQDDTSHSSTTITPRQYVVSVSGSAADASSNPSDFGSSATDRIGMMHVNTSTGDIFIFS
jgi:hypothetical protein